MSKSTLGVGPHTLALPALVTLLGCEDASLSTADIARLGEQALGAEDLPSSPTNAFADRADAAALGQRLFFDRRLSSEGTVACADCHSADQGFSDDRRRSEGVGGQLGGRHALPLTSASLLPFLLWDGRADSVWRQPLYALENGREMDFTRTDVALFVASELGADYEAVFGALPSLEGVPAHVRPGDPAWDGLDAEKQDAVQRVFVNVGKAIEAYERRLTCADTRFDQWARGEVELSDAEARGAARFVDSGCILCHSGPAFSDGAFHNLGLVRSTDAEIDRGREVGLAVLLDDPLNGAGAYSDDPAAGAERLAQAAQETGTLGAFRTASLRGVTQRARFGHLGDHTSLEDFIQDTYRRGGRGGPGRGDRDGDGDGNGAGIVGTLDPILDEVNLDGGDAAEIVAFLRTLECPQVESTLLVP